MFVVTQGKGFHLELPNGVTVSVQWGHGSYSENWRGLQRSSSTAELAAWYDGTDGWLTEQLVPGCGSNVLPDQTVAQFIDFLNKAAALPPKEEAK